MKITGLSIGDKKEALDLLDWVAKSGQEIRNVTFQHGGGKWRIFLQEEHQYGEHRGDSVSACAQQFREPLP